AQRNGAVLERLVVDGHRPRGSDLILAAVPPANRAAFVVFGLDAVAQLAVHLCSELRLAILADKGQYGNLDWRKQRVQSQDGSLLSLDLVLVIGVDEKREQGPVEAGGGLDHVWDVALATGSV